MITPKIETRNRSKQQTIFVITKRASSVNPCGGPGGRISLLFYESFVAV
jgi:hypothetical protein